MNVAGLKLDNNLEYRDLVVFMENMDLNYYFRQIPIQNIGEIYYE